VELDAARQRREPARPRTTPAAAERGAAPRRRVDLHHIQYWSNGGHTTLGNLVSLCRYHHTLVHDRGYLIAARDGTFTCYRPDGTPLPASPPLPQPGGAIEDCHDADITPETIIPPWYGERLDLDYAIAICFANAEQEQRSHLEDGEPEVRDRVTIYEPEDWDQRIRRYYDEHPRAFYRVIEPIPV
jgi:hypothetical protein